MDQMKISSKFTTGLISKIIANIIKKKLNCDAQINLNEISFTIDENAKVHLDVDAVIPKDEITKILKLANI